MENITTDVTPQEDKTNLSKRLNPIESKQRIAVMDLLRGFALIGILFMNIEWFNRPVNDLLAFDFTQTGGDWASSWLVKVFVEGKFYKLFSLLFGMGFAVMLLRAQEVGRPFGAWFTRRMLALYIFGLCHMIFFWGGDILHDYAFAGLVLLGLVCLLRTKRFTKYNHPDTFLKIGLWIILFPLFISICVSLFFGVTRSHQVMSDEWQQNLIIIEQTEKKVEELKAQPDFLTQIEDTENTVEEAEGDEEEVDTDNMTPEELIAYKVEQKVEKKIEREKNAAKETAAFTQTSYFSATKYRTEAALKKLGFSPFFATFVCFPLFLIGYWLVATERLKKPELHQTFFNVLCYGGLSLGIVLNISGTYLALHPAAKGAVEITGVGNSLFFYGQSILAMGYLAAFVKLSSNTTFLRLFSWLSSLGKMALTNYISHSIILSCIFYGYGGGMFGQIPRTEQMLMVVVIIFCQAIISTMWLRYFRFGPLEWLWRSMTYLKLQPLRIKD